VLLLLGLTLLAIAQWVSLGEREVLKIVLEQFRSSGRLFWPVGYTLMTAGLVTALKVRRPLNFALVLAAAMLQFVDAGPLRDKVAATVRSAAPFNIPAEPWRALIAAHERLTVVPSFDCAGYFNRHVLDLVFHASSRATPVNTAYLARRSAADCGQESVFLQSKEIRRRRTSCGTLAAFGKGASHGMPRFKSLCRSLCRGLCLLPAMVWSWKERLRAGFCKK
jgi:hypothetical protein